jgi:hypothetical protein
MPYISKLTNAGGVSTVTRYTDMLAGNAVFNPSAMKLIQNTTLTSTQNGITFSSIPQTYKHLQLVINAKGTSTEYYYGHIYLRFNGLDGASAYGGLKNQAYNVDWGSSISAFGSYPATTLDAGYYVDNFSGTNNMFGPMVVDIPNYTSTTQNKTTTSRFGFITGLSTGQNTSTTGWGSGVSFNTAAITSILVNNYGSQFVSGTTISLYGFEG